MFPSKHSIDERSRAAAGHAAGIWLGVTQVLLAGVVFYRLYVLGQPDEEIRDFQAVLGISLFGFIALQLFLGGREKGAFLKAFGADIFFDDQQVHVDSAKDHVATAHVPSGIVNELK